MPGSHAAFEKISSGLRELYLFPKLYPLGPSLLQGTKTLPVAEEEAETGNAQQNIL